GQNIGLKFHRLNFVTQHFHATSVPFFYSYSFLIKMQLGLQTSMQRLQSVHSSSFSPSIAGNDFPFANMFTGHLVMQLPHASKPRQAPSSIETVINNPMAISF
ncbi:MAG: hypothetical protein PVG67_05900, partial [Desulfobacterales bacterium]